MFDLFKRLGWTAIINDDLIENALLAGAVVVGGLTALTVFLFEKIGMDFGDDYLVLVFAGFILGIVMASITLGVIDSAVATIFVCFAEDPAAGQSTQPQLFSELINTWFQFHGPVMTTCGYSAYR